MNIYLYNEKKVIVAIAWANQSINPQKLRVLVDTKERALAWFTHLGVDVSILNRLA